MNYSISRGREKLSTISTFQIRYLEFDERAVPFSPDQDCLKIFTDFKKSSKTNVKEPIRNLIKIALEIIWVMNLNGCQW